MERKRENKAEEKAVQRVGGILVRILNFGSMNLDYVYEVDTFLLPKETKFAKSLSIHCGGKGLNQSVAAAKAGNSVVHAGIVGKDGEILEKMLQENGVDTRYLDHLDVPCGHAVIQVEDSGQNCILLYGGTNKMLTKSYINKVLDDFGNEGLVLLQNETNLVGYIIEEAHKRGLQTILNAAPMEKAVLSYPLGLLNWLIVNEVEGRQLAKCEKDEEIIPVLKKQYPNCGILLTLGSRGACCYQEGKEYTIGCFQVPVVDTTGAGDTFSGYFLYGIYHGKSIPYSLLLASTASAIAVGRIGAAEAVPLRKEVEKCMAEKVFGSLKVMGEE